jgi:hypothetical protein
MAPNSKDSRTRLLEPLATDMAAFRAAMGMGITEIGVIREAVRTFIDDKLAGDENFRARFEVEKKRLLEQRHQPIRLVIEPSAK